MHSMVPVQPSAGAAAHNSYTSYAATTRWKLLCAAALACINSTYLSIAATSTTAVRGKQAAAFLMRANAHQSAAALCDLAA
jgi:hypothetical protein